jgi:acetolactate synthase-1/2/3 large subunit
VSQNPEPANAPNGAETLVRMLQLHGVKHIFGLCGDTSLPFYDALYRLDHGIAHILTRDERSAAYMADGYARVSGRVGVCEGPSGGGATYLLPGLVEANESSVPVLGITSDVPVTSRGRYPLTELDQKGLYRPLTKWNAVVDLVDQIPDTVRAAFRAMTTGRPGSAHIGLPYDVQKQRLASADNLWADATLGTAPAWRTAPDPAAIERAAELILGARNPVIICGGAVISADATAELDSLARLLDIAVCTTVSGKGALADDHPLGAGVVGANGGVMATRAVVEAADLVVFIGCRAGSTTTENWRFPRRGMPIVHIDGDPMVIGANYPTAAPVVGDVRLALAALVATLKANIAARNPQRADGRAAVARARAAKRAAFQPLAESDERPIRPERIIAELNRVLPADAIVVADPGTPCPYVSAYYDLPKAGRHFLTNRAHGALGYAMSAAIGAHYASPSSRCVAIMGDGSFGFTVGELETITRKNVPLMMVVLSNSVFGWIKASQKAGYDERYFSVDFSRSAHARIAEAYGVKAYTVEDPGQLAATLRQAVEHAGPVLVDIPTQPLQEARAPVSQWMG